MSFRNLTIRTKLITSFGTLAVLLIGLGLFALSQLRTVNAAAGETRDKWLPSVQVLGDVKYAITRYRLFGARQAITSDPAQVAALVQTTQAIGAQLAEHRQAYERLISSPEERRLYEGFAREWSAYDAIHKPMLEQAKGGDLAGAALAFNTTSLQPFNTALKALDDLIKLNRDGAAASGRQAQAAYDQAFILVGAGVAVGALVALLAAFWIMATVSRPMVQMTGAMRRLADGDLEVAVPGAGRGDEIGAMATTVEVFRRNALEVRRMEAEAEEAALRATAEKRAAMNAIADRFEAEVMGVARAVAAAAEQLQANARSMNGVAEGTNRQSQSVAAASQETSANVQTVAAAAEELSASVAEIGGQVTMAASAAGQASGDAQGAGARVTELASSVSRIGQVVDLINQIAAQTNLLALNATIEAARAGDAGKGFAVVASEVKTLASQTAKATEEIAGQIGAVQGATDEVVQAIQAVAGRIAQVNEISGAIAAAVQEQGAAVAEIARNVQQAAQGTEEVTGAITGVSRAAEETGQVAGEMVQASGDLARQAEVLTQQIGEFMVRVRAA